MNKDKGKMLFLLLVIACLIVVTQVADTKASVGSVTGYEKITWGISTGRYYVNEIHAFCAEYNKSWPTVGTEVNEIVPCTNDVLRKALYYGYNGPGNTLGTDERAHVLTAIAVSDANIGETATGASATYDAFYWELVNNSSNYPSPPSNFKAYLAITNSDKMQNLAFYEMEKNGYVSGIKKSTNLKLNKDNNCYSLAGAQYRIYAGETWEESVWTGTLITDSNGNTNTLELPAGSYFAQEHVAPKGFAKNKEVVSFTISAEQTTTLEFKDVPQSNPIDILVQKVDAETRQNKPQGNAKLEGAQFKVHYYAGIWQENVDPAKLGATARKVWVFETDKNGVVKYNKDYFVKGDDLYESIPLGTLVVQEIKASEGYLINESVFVRQIKGSGDVEYVNSFSSPIVSETAIEVHVTKYQDETECTIPGTVFEHTTPDGTRRKVTTDENGKLVLKGVQYGVHTLWEISVMDGYVIRNPINTFSIDENTKDHIEIAIYNTPAPYDIIVHKTDDYDNKLSGAEFVVCEDSECTVVLQRGSTDDNGVLRLCGLEVGKKYYLKEVKAPTGYEIEKDEKGDEHVYEIHATSTPIKDEFTCHIDDKECDNVSGTKANREVNINIKNDVGYVLPKTGSSATMLMNVAGLALCTISLYLNKKQKKGETNYEKN